MPSTEKFKGAKAVPRCFTVPEDYREGLPDLLHTCRRLLERTDFFVPLEDAIWKRIRNHCKAHTLRIMEADAYTIALAPCDLASSLHFSQLLRYMREPHFDETYSHGGGVSSRMALLVWADRCTWGVRQ